MYEIWVSNEDPTFHFVRKVGSKTKPAFCDPLKWTQLGRTNKLDQVMAREVEGLGFATVTRIGVAFNPDEEFG